MTREQAKAAMMITACQIQDHYRVCAQCASTSKPCPVGEHKWAEVAMRHVDLIKTCVFWHIKNHKGPARADILIEKMTRVVRMVK